MQMKLKRIVLFLTSVYHDALWSNRSKLNDDWYRYVYPHPLPFPSHLALKMNKTEGLSRGIDHYRKYQHTIMLFVCHPKILHASIVYGLRDTENTYINAYAKFWGDEQRALCYVSVVVNYYCTKRYLLFTSKVMVWLSVFLEHTLLLFMVENPSHVVFFFQTWNARYLLSLSPHKPMTNGLARYVWNL